MFTKVVTAVGSVLFSLKLDTKTVTLLRLCCDTVTEREVTQTHIPAACQSNSHDHIILAECNKTGLSDTGRRKKDKTGD